MTASKKEKSIIWVTMLVIDLALHKTTQLEFLRHLSKRGYDTTLIALRSKFKYCGGNRSYPHIMQVPLRFVPLLAPLMYSVILTIILPIYIVVKVPKIIIMDPEFSIFSSIPSLIIAKIKGTKFILDIRSIPVEVSGIRGLIQSVSFNMAVLFAKKNFNGLTIITPFMRDEICKKFGINQSKFGVWTSGVSNELFNPDVCIDHGKKLRAELGLSNKFIVFYHGYLSVPRGVMKAVKAIEILSERHEDIVLFLLGSGPAVPVIKKLIEKDPRLKDSLFLRHPVNYSEVPKYISMSDVCIIPLPDHPFWRSQSPLKLFEYLSMGKVILATDIPAHRSVLGDNECSLYLHSTEPKEIANAIEKLYNLREELFDRGKVGRLIVESTYTWDCVVESFERYVGGDVGCH